VKRTRRSTTSRSAIALATVATMALVSVGVGSASAADAPAKKKGTPVAVDVGDTDGTKAPMTMTVTPSSVAAGRVRFTVTNSGTVIHEFVIIKTKTPYDKLPVTKNKVSESKAIGEIEDVAKGKTKSATFKLKAGKYVLACNIAKHYGLGMRAPFTVT